MTTPTPPRPRARREEGLRLLASGLAVAEVARRLGVTPRTVARWRRQAGGRPAAPAAPASGASVTAMLRAEAPHVARVLLDMAKGGDMRAAALVMKLLGDQLESAESLREGEADVCQRELERELESLPPAIAAEMVALLAKAEAELQGAAGGPGERVDGPGRRSRRLPWEAEGDPSGEG